MFAQEFSRASPSSAKFVLTARSAEGLAKTKQLIHELAPDVDVTVVAGDFKEISASFIEKLFDSVSSSFDQALLINNAGSLGNVSVSLSQQTDFGCVSEYFSLNVAAPIVLTSQFLKRFQSARGKYVVNISSLCAIEPFESFGLYCAGKAARDMASRVLAKETSDVRVLNWAPGPMDTEMTQRAADESQSDRTRKLFGDMKKEQKYVPLEDSVQKLILLLAKDEFESGIHLDFYDV